VLYQNILRLSLTIAVAQENLSNNSPNID